MKNLFSLCVAVLAGVSVSFAQCDADHTVEVSSFQYAPADLAIEVGQSVAFINVAGFHDVNGVTNSITGEPFGNPVDFSLAAQSGDMDGVCLGVVTFDTPGTYNYDCSIGEHAAQGMVASITVNALPTNTVVDIIVNSEDHTTLEAAVVAAGLVETLSGEGPFTVFAPTDAAFAALPAGTVEAVLADIDLLTAILTYHVVGGTALSTDLTDGMMVTTLNGADVTVTINADGVFINDAQVIVADILADNGVVHVIDAVLIPATDNVNEAEVKWTMMPNPASDVVTLRGLAANAQITVLDLSGREVIQVAPSQRVIGVSDLAPGTYLVMVKQGANVRTEKLIVR
jgi:uncharacterized surface protein with fasciclin (FAS1) repeats